MNLRLSLPATGAWLKGRPWVAASGQLSYRRPPAPGTVLRVQDPTGDFLGWAVSEGPGRAPAFRLLSRERHADFGAPWWQGVVERGLARRASAGPLGPEALRLLDSDADGVPGLRCEACAGSLFLALDTPALADFLPLIEAALVRALRPRGVWRRFADGGAWGPWHRSPSAAASPARFEAVEGPLRRALDLDADPAAAVPPWPPERRPWRAWIAANCPGREVLAVGPSGDLEDAARAAGPASFTALAAPLRGETPRAERFLVDLPARVNAAFGRFDAGRHAPVALGLLASSAAPGALWLLTSAHPALADAGAWERAWGAAGARATLTAVLGPGPDCPEVPRFAPGRRPRAFIFGT